MKRSLFFLFFILFSSVCAVASAGLKEVQDRLYSMSAKDELIPIRNEKWMGDFDKGLVRAKEENKLLLVAFLGSSWCPWSQKIETEVLNEYEFVTPVSRDFIMVSVNLAEGAGKRSELKSRYAVEELPTLIITDWEGKEVTRVGFLPKTPAEFALHLTKIKRDFIEVQQVVQREDLTIFSAKELERLYLKAKKQGFNALTDKLFLAGLQVDKGLFFLLEQYRHLSERGTQGSKEGDAVRKKIRLRDPDNEQGGFRALALLDFQSLAEKRSTKKKHVKAALKPIVDYVQKYGKEDTENLWRMELLIAQFLYGKNKAKEALLHAKSAFNHAPQENKAEIVDTISYLENKVKKG